MLLLHNFSIKLRLLQSTTRLSIVLAYERMHTWAVVSMNKGCFVHQKYLKNLTGSAIKFNSKDVCTMNT